MTVGFKVRMSALVLVAALGGCAGEPAEQQVASAGGTVTPSAGAGQPVDRAEQGRQFAKCMRGQGFDMPDPSGDGMAPMPAMEAGDQAAMKKVEAALEKCREFLPDGGEPPKMSAEDIAKARDFARCARENGAPGFPDPDPQTGRFKLDPGAAEDVDLSAVGDKCQQFGAGMMPGIEVAG
jgi:hypothetical protein